jgi:outer membrane immunogenic protein
MKRIVVASVLPFLLGLCQADAAEVAPPPPISSNLPANDEVPTAGKWAGIYLGINGGYGFGSSQWSLAAVTTNAFNTGGFLLGGTIGVNYAVSQVLFGLEGDLDWSTLNGSVGGCAVNTGGAAAACETKNNLLGTVRARVGYSLDRTLVYVTGGGAFGSIQTGLNPPTSFNTAAHLGLAVGAGVEFALSPNWSAKAEYLFLDFNNASCSGTAACGSAASAAVVLTENIIRGGLNYKFSW